MTGNQSAQPTRLKESLRLYGLFNWALSFDLYAAIKVIVFYQVTHSYEAAAGLISITLLSSALSEIPTGVFADLIGRKRTIFLGSFCILVSYTLYALDLHFLILAGGALLEGLALALFSGNNTAYLHNLLSSDQKQEEYHHEYGHIMALNTFASVLGVFVGGWIATWSVPLLLWINLLPKGISFMSAILLKEVKGAETGHADLYRHLSEAVKEMRQNKTLRYVSLSTILGGGGFAAGELQAAAFAAVWPTWAIGLAKGIQSVAGIPGYYYAGTLIDKLGAVKIMALGLITSVMGNVLTSATRSVISPLFVMLSLPLYGPSDTAQQQILQREFPERQRATIASVNALGNSLSASLVLYLCGIVANHYGPFIALLATQLFFLPSVYFQILFFKQVKDTHS